MQSFFQETYLETGCDEAGRGCLAGPVFAAAVIWPKDFTHPLIKDSKQLSLKNRLLARDVVQQHAISYALSSVDVDEIDQINIRNAAFLAMRKAVEQLSPAPEMLLIDGNGFNAMDNIKHECFIKGDSRFYSIAAASILAKTHRDDYMMKAHEQYSVYGWDKNKGYGTKAHVEALREHGPCDLHRKSFKVKQLQTAIPFKAK